MEKIYEVCDTTSEEIHFTMGIFLSKYDAIKRINDLCSPDSAFTEYGYDNDYEKIEVRERKIGMNGEGKVVYTLERRMEYDEKTDEQRWVSILIQHLLSNERC